MFFLQSEMRRQGITQADIDKARKSEEAKILQDAQGAKGQGNKSLGLSRSQTKSAENSPAKVKSIFKYGGCSHNNALKDLEK